MAKPLNQRQKRYLVLLLCDSARLTSDGYWWDAEHEKVDLRTIGALVRRGLAYHTLVGVPGMSPIYGFYLTDEGAELAEQIWDEEWAR